MKRLRLLWLVMLCAPVLARAAVPSQDEVLLGQRVNRDSEGRLLARYAPGQPGAAYSQVMGLASEFLLACPKDPKTSLPLYLLTCCLDKPDLSTNVYVAHDWFHTPACLYANCVQSFAVDYFNYTGDARYRAMVREMLDYQLAHGTTPAEWPWGRVPYASSDFMSLDYQGGTTMEEQGFRADGLHGIEPDKVGELGYGYLRFYEITGETRYLDAALDCARALAKHVRTIKPGQNPDSPSHTEQSPWPFRVNARTGVVRSEYCSNVLDPVALFNELLRIRATIHLSASDEQAFARARDLAWGWLFSRNGPMKTFIWNGFFEDIPNDPERSNRVQITPAEVAQYLIQHPEVDPNLDIDVPALLSWIECVFKDERYPAIKEQTWCYYAMGSHSARFGSACAQWYERAHDPAYKEKAFRYLNYATYMTLPDGFVSVGHGWPGAWFSDGYGDYVRHFAHALAAVPEWAPADENHLLRCSSIVQRLTYAPRGIDYVTFDEESESKLRLTSKPKSVTIDDKVVSEGAGETGTGWNWTGLEKGGVLRIFCKQGRSIRIRL